MSVRCQLRPERCIGVAELKDVGLSKPTDACSGMVGIGLHRADGTVRGHPSTGTRLERRPRHEQAGEARQKGFYPG